jgi:hypothetical protein
MRIHRFAAQALLVGALAFGTSGCIKSSGGGGGNNPGGGGISQGLGANDASGDVKLGGWTKDGYGFASVKVTVTNNSSERSDYFIDIALQSPGGGNQYDTTTVFVQNLEPGQTKKDKGQFLSTGHVPNSAVVVIKSIQRTASF